MGVLTVIQCHIRHQRVQRNLIGNALKASAWIIGAATLLAAPIAAAVSQPAANDDSPIIHPLLAQAAPTVSEQLPNGVYLFGEQPLPDRGSADRDDPLSLLHRVRAGLLHP